MNAHEPETWWQVYTLPRTDGIEFNLRLWTASDDPEVIEKIESAAGAAGMVIERRTCVKGGA